MRSRFMVLATLAGVAVLAVPSTSHASHHLWKLSQIFSNASGSVQFAELSTAPTNVTDEPNVGAHNLTANGHVFNFVTNLTVPAHWLLVATAGFQNLPGGVQPDYILPTSFFSTGGGTIAYAEGLDTWNYGVVPTDGVHSLMRDGSTAVNSPINTLNQAGSVTVTPPVPALPATGIMILVALLLLSGSGLIRWRKKTQGT
jgi:hypothetical protein